jgi:hypothetical protein
MPAARLDVPLGGRRAPAICDASALVLRVRGDATCALITGMSYEACFDLDRYRREELSRFALCNWKVRNLPIQQTT